MIQQKTSIPKTIQRYLKTQYKYSNITFNFLNQYEKINYSGIINIKDNEVQTIGEREISSGRMKYLIFSKTGNQYGFINNEIYLNQVKICSNLKLEEIEYKNKILAITLYLQGNTTYMTNAYSVIK